MLRRRGGVSRQALVVLGALGEENCLVFFRALAAVVGVIIIIILSSKTNRRRGFELARRRTLLVAVLARALDRDVLVDEVRDVVGAGASGLLADAAVVDGDAALARLGDGENGELRDLELRDHVLTDVLAVDFPVDFVDEKPFEEEIERGDERVVLKVQSIGSLDVELVALVVRPVDARLDLTDALDVLLHWQKPQLS